MTGESGKLMIKRRAVMDGIQEMSLAAVTWLGRRPRLQLSRMEQARESDLSHQDVLLVTKLLVTALKEAF